MQKSKLIECKDYLIIRHPQIVGKNKNVNTLTNSIYDCFLNDKTFKSGETVEAADVIHKEMEFLYQDGESWHFMDTSTYEQIEINSAQIGDTKKWLIGQEVCEIVLWYGDAIEVNAPVIVELKITSAVPGVKGDTVSGATKKAILETGVEVQVPLFVNENETIKVDTRDLSYIGRSKS